jgi:hypothetical protein
MHTEMGHTPMQHLYRKRARCTCELWPSQHKGRSMETSAQLANPPARSCSRFLLLRASLVQVRIGFWSLKLRLA